MSRRSSLLKMLLKDRRGAVALETPFVLMFLFFSLLFPLADMTIAGFKEPLNKGRLGCTWVAS